VEQDPQAVSVEFIRLVDVTHHSLRLGGMGQMRHTASSLDLIHNPVPVAHRFEGHGSAWRQLAEEGLDGAGLMVDPCALDDLAMTVQDGEQGKVLAQP